MVPSRYPDTAPPLDVLLAASQSALSLDELLPALAACWREQLAAGLAVIGVDAEGIAGLQASRADESGATALSVSSKLADPSADDGLRQRLTVSANAGEPETWIPLADSGSVIGGILLYPDQRRALISVPTAWVTTTARLLSRAREYQRRLRDDKLEAMAEFAAGAGHEINNPLGSIVMSAQLLLKQESDPERRRLLSRIGAEAYRARDMISDAMTFARPPQPRLEDLDLAEQIDEVLSRFAGEIQERGITVETELQRPTAVRADRTQLAVVISELFRNAMKAVDDNGQVRLECSPGRDVWSARFEIADNGCGLTEKQRAHLFDPFYSGRQAGRGLGFGLSKVWRIVTNQGGRIDLAENTPRGLTFTVWWPSDAMLEP